MRRMGKYTGKIYNEDTDFKMVNECCLMLADYVTEEDMNKAKLTCMMCPGDENCMKGKILG